MNNIKEYRQKLNLSQSDLAKIMNVKQNTISQWENEKLCLMPTISIKALVLNQ